MLAHARGAGSSACRARRRRCPGSRRTASSSGCARQRWPGAREGRDLVALQPAAARALDDQVEHLAARSSSGSAGGCAGEAACSARSSGGRSTGAAARRPARRPGRRRSRASVWPGSAYIRSMLKVSKACARLVHRGARLRGVVHAADGAAGCRRRSSARRSTAASRRRRGRRGSARARRCRGWPRA